NAGRKEREQTNKRQHPADLQSVIAKLMVANSMEAQAREYEREQRGDQGHWNGARYPHDSVRFLGSFVHAFKWRSKSQLRRASARDQSANRNCRSWRF